MYIAQTDASFRPETKNAGIGYALIKNKKIILRCRQKAKSHNINELEAIAVCELIKKIDVLKIKNVEIRTDSENLITRLKSSKKKHKNNKYVQYISSWLVTRKDVKLIKSPRKEVKIAHKLSRESSKGLWDMSISHIPELSKLQRRRLNKRNNKSMQEVKQESGMVVRFRSRILLRCPACKDKKAAYEFPRYRKTNKQRLCNSCSDKLSQIHIC